METKCYEKILEYFVNKSNKEGISEIWKYQSLIKLMKLSTLIKNKSLIKNAIINLMFYFDNIPPDQYNSHGVNINKLSRKNKENCISILKKEFN
ncbi:MAG: hypothetical protein ACFFAN_07065 [Promethearchaeota archaeon]